MAFMFCSNCGKEISENAFACPSCGEPTPKGYGIPANASDREWMPTILLCIFLGGFGVHSFYAGKTIVGILQLLTLGGCGFWALIDLIMIITKNYTDVDGRPIVK